jgi:hypothetical protein
MFLIRTASFRYVHAENHLQPKELKSGRYRIAHRHGDYRPVADKVPSQTRFGTPYPLTDFNALDLQSLKKKKKKTTKCCLKITLAPARSLLVKPATPQQNAAAQIMSGSHHHQWSK